jgi:hypothetical protein
MNKYMAIVLTESFELFKEMESRDLIISSESDFIQEEHFII